MNRLQYFATTTALAIGVVLSPAAFAHGGAGGGGREGFHGGGSAGGFHGSEFHGSEFRRGRPVFGYGFGYPYPYVSDYCSQFPNGYNPAVGCYS
jgi:hypothetical protein